MFEQSMLDYLYYSSLIYQFFCPVNVFLPLDVDLYKPEENNALNRLYTPSTILASIFNFRLISRATFKVGSHLPVR